MMNIKPMEAFDLFVTCVAGFILTINIKEQSG